MSDEEQKPQFGHNTTVQLATPGGIKAAMEVIINCKPTAEIIDHVWMVNIDGVLTEVRRGPVEDIVTVAELLKATADKAFAVGARDREEMIGLLLRYVEADTLEEVDAVDPDAIPLLKRLGRTP